jgi:D-aspartate ligase
MKKWTAIILGSDENAYGCARCFYEIDGEAPLLLCSRALVATDHSRILTRRVISDLDSPSVFSAVMCEVLSKAHERAEKVLVVPCSDYYAELLINSDSRVLSLVDSPVLDRAVYRRFASKGAFCDLCNEFGIAHPQTEIALPSTLLAQKKKRSYPLVLKPANSNHTDYLHSGIRDRKKAYICKNDDELYMALESFVTDGYVRGVAIQEYIEGEESSSAVINAYCDRKARVRLIGIARPLLEYKNPQDIGNYAALTSFSDRKICDVAAAFLEKLGYVGFANFDLKYDKRRGTYLFLELNPRQGRSSYWMRCAGGDLMLEMYRDTVLGEAYSGIKYAEKPCLWINEPLPIIKREMKRRGLRETDILSRLSPVNAFGVSSDMSVPRAVALTKRKLLAYSKLI